MIQFTDVAKAVFRAHYVETNEAIIQNRPPPMHPLKLHYWRYWHRHLLRLAKGGYILGIVVGMLTVVVSVGWLIDYSIRHPQMLYWLVPVAIAIFMYALGKIFE